MPNPSDDAARLPFIAFNFAVEINVPGMSNRICNAAFAQRLGRIADIDYFLINQDQHGANNST